ncbi:MAG: hypothetical protein HZC14_02610 [Candidatus Niyogibacteria bacterium]|nr:hypothetical protein [Candidatus Niyogibacteria bacterium]
MKISSHPFPFIVLEGIDGSGKSTLLKGVQKYLEDKRVPFYITAEPTDLEYGKRIRRILDHGGRDEDGNKVAAEDLQRLYILDRLNHRKSEGEFLKTMAVISDRDWESTLAYAMAFGVNPRWVIDEHARLASEAGIELFFSNLTLIVDITPEEALRRQKAMGKILDYFESDIAKRGKLREAYLSLPAVLRQLLPDIPFNIKVIDGMRPPEEVLQSVLLHLEPLLIR